MLYGPLVGWELWVAFRGHCRLPGCPAARLRPRLAALRSTLSPALVPIISDTELIRLIQNDTVPVGQLRLQTVAAGNTISVEVVELEIPPARFGHIYIGGSGTGSSSG